MRKPAADSTSLALQFHVDPQFLHRALAAQVLGVEPPSSIGLAADSITRHLIDSGVQDLRVAVVQGQLTSLVDHLAMVRAGFYFRQSRAGSAERIIFHSRIGVDAGLELEVFGSWTPHALRRIRRARI